MANIKITAPCPLYDGMPVSFKAPCDCTAVEGLAVAYGGTERVFAFKDAHGNSLTGIGNLFAEGAIVKALLDTVNGFAYLQNADTNSYIESRWTKKTSITLSTSWTASGSNYTQPVTVAGGTAKSLVALQPTAAQIVALRNARVAALVVDNNNGTFTATAVGAKPTAAMTIQATLTEVSA